MPRIALPLLFFLVSCHRDLPGHSAMDAGMDPAGFAGCWKVSWYWNGVFPAPDPTLMVDLEIDGSVLRYGHCRDADCSWTEVSVTPVSDTCLALWELPIGTVHDTCLFGDFWISGAVEMHNAPTAEAAFLGVAKAACITIPLELL